MSPCNDTIEDFAVLRYSKDGRSEVKTDFIERKIPKTSELFDTQKTFNFPGQDGSSSKFPVGKSRKIIKNIVNSQPDDTLYFFMATPKLDNNMLFSKGNHMKYMGECIFGIYCKDDLCCIAFDINLLFCH